NYAPPFRNDLRTIALRQKAVMYCILGYFPLAVAIFALPPESLRVVGLLAIGVTLTMAAFVFMLAIAVYSTAIGIVLGILTLVPFLGFIPLLVINGRATNILVAHGITVGLGGADSRQIPGPG
ncbi:MAG: hypothetical protein JWO87_2572, partial [Phycisphaerales bacterium]|nr:hypothetical protein [Phycisphaerales bacterium]